MWKKQGAAALGKFSIFGRIWKTGQKKTWEFFPGNFFHTVSNCLIILSFCGPAPPDKFWKFSPVLRHGNILHIPQKIPGPSLSDYSTFSDREDSQFLGIPLFLQFQEVSVGIVKFSISCQPFSQLPDYVNYPQFLPSPSPLGKNWERP
jgi:hypothetical protein